MEKIELYIDNNNKLTLDIFRKKEDEFYVKRVKGKACYPYIKQLCETPILSTHKKNKDEELLVEFSRYIINVSEPSKVLERRGTAILRDNIANYETKKNRAKVKPKKVKRVNKHIGKRIIAGFLLLLMLLSSIPIISVILNKWRKRYPEKDPYQIEQQIKKEALDELNKKHEENPIESENIQESGEIFLSISYDDRSNTEKAIRAELNYGEMLRKYSAIYGINPEVMLAIATQERGIHSEIKDKGGATGLMQIQNSVWRGETITAYNYQLGKKESIIVDEKSLSDLEYNIKVGCMVFQNTWNYMDNNILAAIQCYNFGCGNMNKVLNKYSSLTGKTRAEILNDLCDTGWLDCRDAISLKIGDHNYVENVLSWIGPEITFENISYKGKNVNLCITNSEPTKNISIH